MKSKTEFEKDGGRKEILDWMMRTRLNLACDFARRHGPADLQKADERARRLTEGVALIAGFAAAGIFRSNADCWHEIKRALPGGSVFSIVAGAEEDERIALAPAMAKLQVLLSDSNDLEDALIDIFEACEAMKAKGNADELALAFDADALKSQGVFFTPSVIAGRVIETAFAQAGEPPISVLDPAMGAGRFLVKAFRLLAAINPEAARDPAGLAEKALFGVDLNPIAVDFARACLRLTIARMKAARGDGDPLADLPDLSGNLIQGDSLAFPEIFGTQGAGGFDVVVANPPYCFGEQLDAALKSHYARTYRCAQDQYDTYGMFIEAAVTRWLRPGGRYAFLVPDALLVRELTAPVREILIRDGGIETCEHLGDVFESMEFSRGAPKKVGVSVVLISGTRAPYDPERRLRRIDDLRLTNDDSQQVDDDTQSLIINRQSSIVNPLEGLRHSDIIADPLRRFLIYFEDEEFHRYQALAASGVTVADLLTPQGIGRGEETGKKHLASQPSDECAIPIVAGEAVEPFRISSERRYVSQLLARKQKFFEWSPKIMVVKTGRRLIAARDDERLACLQSVYCLQPRDERAAVLLEAWLNSELCAWVVEKTITAYKKLMPQITQSELLALPVPRMDEERMGQLTSLAQRLQRCVGDDKERGEVVREIEGCFGVRVV